MLVKDLIKELKKYDKNLNVCIGNVEDDSDEAIVELNLSAIDKIERFDEFENKLTGEHFIAIGYKCSICNMYQ